MKFHIGDILSITTGKLVSPRLIAGVYDILNFMTGDNLYTHQLPRASKECQPYLLQQHPALAEVDASYVNKANFKAWLAEQGAHYGHELEVEPLPEHAHEFIDPISELAGKVHPDKIIVVRPRKKKAA